jgi:hypothetical protein
MSYTGVRRPSLGSPLLGVLASLLTFAVIFWLGFVTARNATSMNFIWWLEGGLIVSLAVAVVVHESGHLIVGLLSGEPVRMMRVGSGGTLIAFRIKGVAIQLCANPLGGGAVYFSEVGAAPSRVHIASLAAGPGFNALAAVYAFVLYQLGVEWLAPFAIANVIGFVNNIIPRTAVVGGRRHATDGMQIWNLLFQPPAPTLSLEGAVISPDAHLVLVRAIEDAQLSGLAEVTDEQLLRALARDEAVGAVFAAAGLNERIPEARTPESDELASGHLGPVANDLLLASIRKARDLGLSKATAATIALALLASDTAAGRLMREAGVTEESVLRLASPAAGDDEDPERDRVLSPDLALERWGTAADKALAYAFRVAAADRSVMVGTQHMVAALVADPSCRAAQALTRLGFVLVWNGDRDGSLEKRPEVEAPVLSPQAGIAVAGALWRTGPTRPAGTAELCLGILDQRAGNGFQLLAAAGVTADRFIKALRYTPVETSEPCGCTAASYGVWALRASARMGAGRWLDARADFLEAERACVNEKSRAVFQNNVAWVSLVAGDRSLWTDALERARAAIAVDPDNVAFRGTYAFALMETGSPAEAASMLEADLPKLTRPQSRASTLCQLAMCEARLGRRDLAAQRLAASLEASSKCELLERARREVEAAPAATIA